MSYNAKSLVSGITLTSLYVSELASCQQWPLLNHPNTYMPRGSTYAAMLHILLLTL